MSVYLDHAASSPMRDDVTAVFAEMGHLVGNPASLHRPGQRARGVLEEAREELAASVGAHPTEVIFTAGGSEADSLAVLGGWAKRREDGRDRCLISAVEHPAVLGAAAQGAELLPVTNGGVVDVAAAGRLIDERVGLVSVMAVNNETGIIQPVEEVRALAAEAGAWTHSDAVQALGHVRVDFSASGLDMMSLSAHKVGGPVGIGALLSRRHVVPRPVGLGGGQEREVRSGTVPVILAAAFARAAAAAVENLETEAQRMRGYSERISAAALAAGGRLNSSPEGAPHIVHVTFDGIRADDLLFLLDQRGVHASVGSACKAGVHQPSDVLLAMGRTSDEATQSLRFSVGWSTTAAEIDEACRLLPEVVGQARAAF